MTELERSDPELAADLIATLLVVPIYGRTATDTATEQQSADYLAVA